MTRFNIPRKGQTRGMKNHTRGLIHRAQIRAMFLKDRTRTGTSIAEELGLSQPTVSAHLRAIREEFPE